MGRLRGPRQKGDSEEQSLEGDCKKPNGLCTATVGPDGLPVQCIAGHSLEKHDYLRRYIQASSGPRSGFLKARPGVPTPGGAAFIDLFAGPGMVRERATGQILPGSPLLALEHETAPFTKVLLCDLDKEVSEVLTKRVAPHGPRVRVHHGDSNTLIDRDSEGWTTRALAAAWGIRPTSACRGFSPRPSFPRGRARDRPQPQAPSYPIA